MQEFGLRRKKEIWRAEALMRDFRRRARELQAHRNEEDERTLLEKLMKMGVLNESARIDDILELDVKKILSRRLQTMVFKKGHANTAKQARQLITHGHIRICGRKVVYPSYIVSGSEEDIIESDFKGSEKQ